jgi:hypothetical protein
MVVGYLGFVIEKRKPTLAEGYITGLDATE